MLKYLSLLSVSLFLLNGCAGVLVGAGASLGVAAAQEGGLSRAARDFAIQAEINDLWFRHDTSMFTKLDMTVENGRVLLTGVVQDPEHRVEAVRLAWQPAGVDQVINEIQVAESGGLKQFAKDSWISTRLRAAITFDRDVQSINYSVDTVNGIVYLMGAAQSQAELDHVIEIARTINNVNQVVSYVKIIEQSAELSQNEGFVPRDVGREYDPNEFDSGFDSGFDSRVSSGPVVINQSDAVNAPVSNSGPSSAIKSEELLWNDK